jgi:NitT/TauT family transport system ATP-binding protein
MGLPLAEVLIMEAISHPALSVQHLSKTFPSAAGTALPVLQEVSLSVGVAETLAIIGPSGCGKSTLLRMAAGLEPLDQSALGAIEVCGAPPGHNGTRVGFIFQTYSSFPWLTALQNVDLAARRIHPDRAIRADVVAKQLKLVRLREYAHSFPDQLSGGQRQRLAFACALAMDPQLLLMDEPMGALDPLTREHLQLELLSLWTAQRHAAVLVTHDISEALLLGDRVVVMSQRPASIILELDTALGKPWLSEKDLTRLDLEMAARDVRKSHAFLEMADQLRDTLAE